MNKILSMLLAAALVFSLGSFAFADDVIYGTMDIPFALFYAEEGPAYEVDAVSSATNSKWFSPSLATGGYSVKHENDDGGDILGVTYPVSISQADLEALGENNFNFQALDTIPAAFKAVTVMDGLAAFSAVQGDTAPLEASAVLTTSTVWGDYEIDVDAINNSDGTSDIGPIYGVLLTADDGAVYALRQLENIWRDELSWSSGIYTVEPHGNVMSSANFADLMGKTIVSITYITDTGYHVLATDLYVPVKFEGGVTVESVEASALSAAVSFENLPEDYAPVYSVSGLDASVEEGVLSWDSAFAGAYTLTVNDESGKYAPLTAAFVLSTDAMPADYDEASNSIVAAEGFEDAAFEAYLANITAVSVNGEKYAASGRGAVAIIDSDGEVDTDAALVSGRGADAVQTPIFAESGEYEVAVEAAGYTQVLSFVVTVE